MVALSDLLAKGYFPKELPTPFNTRSYAAAMAARTPPAFSTARYETWLCRHGLARPAMLNRTLGIPHPLHYFWLAQSIAANWPSINAVIATSRLSISSPVDDPKTVRALVPASLRVVTDERAHHRARARYIVRADVNRCYPSIYTHSLAWAAHTKAVAKANPTSKSLYGNELDRHVRSGQGKQTFGIPIGPDTSFALGEMVLSACDALVQSSARSVHGFRLYDDYELYAGSAGEADGLVVTLQEALATFELALNPHKLEIATLPQSLEPEWKSALRVVPYRPGRETTERADITLLFDTAFRAAAQNKSESVLAYALGRFISQDHEERRRVRHPANWPRFQRLALQAALAEPGVLPKVAHLLYWERTRGRPIEKTLVSQAVNALAVDAASKGHASEVAWAIWAAIALGLRIQAPAARVISRMSDDIVALTALHGRVVGAMGPGLDVSHWASWMTDTELRGEHWLTAYEAFEHGWLPSATGSDYIAADPVAAFMRSAGVRFYDEAATLPAARKAVPGPAIGKVQPAVAKSLVRVVGAHMPVGGDEEWDSTYP